MLLEMGNDAIIDVKPALVGDEGVPLLEVHEGLVQGAVRLDGGAHHGAVQVVHLAGIAHEVSHGAPAQVAFLLAHALLHLFVLSVVSSFVLA